jgi:hypothetical protein
MDYKFFFSGLKNLILNPVKAWEIIDSENKPVKVVRNSFLFPLLILVAVSAFAGSIIFTNTQLSPVYSIFVAIRTFVVVYFTVYAAALIIGEITFPLDLGKDFAISFRLVVYTITPFLICQIFSCLFESLLFMNVLGLYGLYIFWTGADKLLAPPHYKKMPLLVASLLTIGTVYIVSNVLLTKIIDKLYYAFFA